jgi:hypothetical protein
VAALYENGIESYNAVPIVRDVLKAYFDKKARESRSQTLSTSAHPPALPTIFASTVLQGTR